MPGPLQTTGEQIGAPGARPGATPPLGVGSIIRRYCVLWVSYALANGFLLAVYPLFLRARGLDQLEINSVLATYFAVTFLTDVPTGAFADAIGRRRAFVLGCTIRLSAFMLYFFAHRYAIFLVAEAIDGVGTTFCNGAVDAWAVDELDDAGFEGLKDRMFSRSSQLMNLGWMVTALIGTWIADYNLAWPWLCGAAGFACTAAVGAAVMRERRPHHAHVEFARIPAMVGGRIVAGFRLGFRSRTILLLSIANGIFFAAWAPYWIQWPQYVNDAYAVGPWIIGWFFSLFTIARLAGAEVVVRLTANEAARPARLIVVAATMSVTFLAGGTLGARPSVVIGLFVLMNFAMGALDPLTRSWLNEQIGESDRVTLLSFHSTFATVGGSLGLLAVGAYADRAGIPASWQVSAIISLAMIPCYWILHRQVGAPAIIPVPASE